MAITPIRLEGLTVKVESTYGTDPTPAAGTDGVRVSDRVWSSVSHDFAFPNDRPNAATGTLLPVIPATPKGRIANLEIACEVMGAGAAYSSSVKPEVHVLLLACGMAATLDATGGAEKYTYTFADSSHSSCTIWAYAGGLLFKVVGCRGTVRIPVDAGSIGTIIFSMQGLVDDPATASLANITSYDATLPAVATGMTVTVGSWAPDIVSAEYATNTAVAMVADGNATDGINSFEINSFAPTMSISAKAALMGHSATLYNPYNDMQERTNRTIDVTIGSVRLGQMKLDINIAHIASINHVDQDGFTGWDLTYNCYDGSIIYS